MLLGAALACAALNTQGVMAGELGMGINDVITAVDTGNASVRQARKGVDVARRGVDAAKAARLPDIDASLSVGYLGNGTITDRDFSGAICDHLPHFTNAASLTVYQPLWTGGALTASIDMARTRELLAATRLDGARSTARLEALTTYFRLMMMLNLVEVYEENIALTERLIANMQARRDQGVALKNDITRYELRLTSLRYDLVAVRNSIGILNNDLVTLLGLPEGTVVKPDNAVLEAPQPIEPLEWWLRTATAQAPSLRQAAAEVDAARQAERLARAERMPRVGVVAGDSFSGPVTIEIPALDKNYNYWYAGLSLTYSFSSLYKADKRVAEARQATEQARLGADASADALQRAVTSTHTLCLQSFEQLATERKSVELAEENYRVVSNRFDHQLALLTDMLDASTARLDAQQRLVNARINTLIYYYQLHCLSGLL